MTMKRIYQPTLDERTRVTHTRIVVQQAVKLLQENDDAVGNTETVDAALILLQILLQTDLSD